MMEIVFFSIGRVFTLGGQVVDKPLQSGLWLRCKLEKLTHTVSRKDHHICATVSLAPQKALLTPGLQKNSPSRCCTRVAMQFGSLGAKRAP